MAARWIAMGDRPLTGRIGALVYSFDGETLRIAWCSL